MKAKFSIDGEDVVMFLLKALIVITILLALFHKGGYGAPDIFDRW